MQRDDIQYYLFNNSSYSDLTIICNKTPIYLHSTPSTPNIAIISQLVLTVYFTEPILVSRWASFMALIKPVRRTKDGNSIQAKLIPLLL